MVFYFFRVNSYSGTHETLISDSVYFVLSHFGENSLNALGIGFSKKEKIIKHDGSIWFGGGSPMSPQIARKVIEFFSQPGKQKKESPLSVKEKEIVIGLVDGLSYKLIAARMNISIETVRFHIKNIYSKLHVHGKAEVISRSLKGEI